MPSTNGVKQLEDQVELSCNVVLGVGLSGNDSWFWLWLNGQRRKKMLFGDVVFIVDDESTLTTVAEERIKDHPHCEYIRCTFRGPHAEIATLMSALQIVPPVLTRTNHKKKKKS